MVVSTAVAHRIPAGWYRDLDDPARRRWWNGVEWTDYYAPVTQPILTLVESTDEASGRREAAGGHSVLGSRRVPLLLLLAALAGANAVLLSILAGTA